MPVSLPHAARREAKWENLEQMPNLGVWTTSQPVTGASLSFTLNSKRLKDEGDDVQLVAMPLPLPLRVLYGRRLLFSSHMLMPVLLSL